MKKLLDFFFGTVTFEINSTDAEKALNILHGNMIYMKKMPKMDCEKFSFTVAKSNRRKAECLLDKSGIKVYSIRRRGLPFAVMKYRKRYGIFVGFAIFCFLLYLSQQIVWEIDFSGNENISDIDVERQLLEVGFGVGSYIPNVDFYTLSNEFIMSSDDFSFISVNMEGTKAHVELRERKKKDEKTEYAASNIVAKYGGIIESMTVYSGQTVIEKESVVKEGDLLVSGFVEKTSGFDIVRSQGSVYAYVTREFEVEIPFEKNVKKYTGKGQNNIDLIFFGMKFNLKKGIDGSFESYDEYTDVERLVLFDRIKLPLVLSKTTAKEYEANKGILNENEAKKQAEKEMSRILADELFDSEILERKTTEGITEKSYKLKCSIYCISDIACEKEILLSQKTDNKN